MRYKIIASLHKRGYHACFVGCLSICGTVCQGCVLGVLGFANGVTSSNVFSSIKL